MNEGRTSTSYEDFFANDEQPRVWKTEDRQSGRPVFHTRPPCGHHGVQLAQHAVELNEDGTFTVRPNPPWNPSNSNSILCACGWHGYIDHNVWRSV